MMYCNHQNMFRKLWNNATSVAEDTLLVSNEGGKKGVQLESIFNTQHVKYLQSTPGSVCTQSFQWFETDVHSSDMCSPSLSQVFDCLQHRELNVTVLSDSSVAEYKTADYLCGGSAPFLRSLHSSAFTGPSACRSLEQPNIVTGLPAAGTANCTLNSPRMPSSCVRWSLGMWRNTALNLKKNHCNNQNSEMLNLHFIFQ